MTVSGEIAADTRSAWMIEGNITLIKEWDLPCFVSCLTSNGASTESVGWQRYIITWKLLELKRGEFILERNISVLNNWAVGRAGHWGSTDWSIFIIMTISFTGLSEPHDGNHMVQCLTSKIFVINNHTFWSTCNFKFLLTYGFCPSTYLRQIWKFTKSWDLNLHYNSHTTNYRLAYARVLHSGESGRRWKKVKQREVTGKGPLCFLTCEGEGERGMFLFYNNTKQCKSDDKWQRTRP